MAARVKVVGVGDFVPAQVVSNETMALAIPGSSAEMIREKTGIVERRFLCEIDSERGRSIRPTTGPRSNCDTAELAVVAALKMANLAASDLGAIFCGYLCFGVHRPARLCRGVRARRGEAPFGLSLDVRLRRWRRSDGGPRRHWCRGNSRVDLGQRPRATGAPARRWSPGALPL